jgi:Ion channel
VIVAVLSQVLTTEYVTLDTVVGAASVYVLIGLLWATIYALLEFWWPGSFNFPATFQPAAPTALVPLMKDTIILYYSFETLTTVAYGDITPATPPARFFSVAEAMVGQLYLAVLVARFVGLQVTHYASTHARKE